MDLKDGETPVQVEVEFLAAKEVKLKKRKPKLLQDFRVLRRVRHRRVWLSPQDSWMHGAGVQVYIDSWDGDCVGYWS